MTYPKEVMSISELVKLGFPRASLYKAANHRLAEKFVIKTAGGGKFLFRTAEFEKNIKFIFR